MNNIEKLQRCTPIEAQPCNYEDNNATPCATDVQPNSLKALVEQRFTRNQSCNQSATHAKRQCNFESLEKRVLMMAKRWCYTPEELLWALKEAKSNPESWSQLCVDDENSILF